MDIDRFLEGCKSNDRKAQEMLYRSLASKMMAICLRYAHSQFEAEEILQAGFIKVFKNINQVADIGAFEGWIRRIMVNTAIESYRTNVHFQNIDEVKETDFAGSQSFEIDQLE